MGDRSAGAGGDIFLTFIRLYNVPLAIPIKILRVRSVFWFVIIDTAQKSRYEKYGVNGGNSRIRNGMLSPERRDPLRASHTPMGRTISPALVPEFSPSRSSFSSTFLPRDFSAARRPHFGPCTWSRSGGRGAPPPLLSRAARGHRKSQAR